MIDENFKINKEEAKTYPPLPKNVYQVELLDVVLNDAKGQYAKPGEKVFSFQFTLLDGTENGESLRGRNVWDNFVSTSLYIGKNGKNSLYGIVEAFIGRELTREEEAMGLDSTMLNSFIGKQIKVFVDHKPSKKDPTVIYDNITSYMKPEAILAVLTEEEKEKARVKKDSHSDQAIDEQSPAPTEEIPVNNVAF